MIKINKGIMDNTDKKKMYMKINKKIYMKIIKNNKNIRTIMETALIFNK